MAEKHQIKCIASLSLQGNKNQNEFGSSSYPIQNGHDNKNNNKEKNDNCCWEKRNTHLLLVTV